MGRAAQPGRAKQGSQQPGFHEGRGADRCGRRSRHHLAVADRRRHGTQQQPDEVPAPVASLAFSPRNNQLAASMWFNGSVILMDVTTGDGKVLTEYENATQSVTPMGPSVWKIVFTPDGNRACHGRRGQQSAPVAGARGHTRADLQRTGGFRQQHRFLGGWEEAGRPGDDDLTATVWDAASGALLSTLSGHSGEVTGVAFLPGGKYLATASSDGDALALLGLGGGGVRFGQTCQVCSVSAWSLIKTS